MKSALVEEHFGRFCGRPLRLAKWRIRNIYSRSMDAPKRIFTLVKAANILSIVAEVRAYGASTPQGQPFATPDFNLLEHTNAARSFCPFSAV
jgi:hypothetical protein